MKFNWIRLIGLLLYVGIDIGVSVYDHYVNNEQNRTSYLAHIAGALAGFLIGLCVLRNLKARRWKVILGWFVFIVYILLMGFAIIFNIVNEKHFPNVNRCDRNDRSDRISNRHSSQQM
jgi:cell division protein FtsW (lipid II flippase)